MKSNISSRLMLALFASLMFIACTKEDSIVPEITVPQGAEDYFSDAINFPVTGGYKVVNFTTNVDWKLIVSRVEETNEDWFHISKTEGTAGDNRIALTIGKNEEYNDRCAILTIEAGGISKNITICQYGSAILVISQKKFLLNSEGDTISVKIDSNFDFEVEQPDVDWIRQINVSRGVSSHTLFFEVIKNTTYDNREATITIKDINSSKKESVHIEQMQKNAILLASSVRKVEQEGGLIAVNVSSNIDYSIEVSAQSKSWITKIEGNSTRALRNDSIHFDISKNENYLQRKGEIYFKYENIVDTLTIEQAGGAIISFNQDIYNIGGGSTDINVDIFSNIEYSISLPDWITDNTVKNTSTGVRTFSVEANRTGELRTGFIVFSSSDGSRKDTITVNQEAIILATSLDIEFYNYSGTYGGKLYIGKEYGFIAQTTPSNATVEYEWRVEDPNIASISGGKNGWLETKDYGTSKVIVTEKYSGLSESYEFGTCVTNFKFTETSKETKYGCPVILLELGSSHQLKCTYSPSYANKVFSNLNAFNFKEVDERVNAYVIVDESSIVDIDENGLMTAKKIGTTIIEVLGRGVFKDNSNGSVTQIFVEVVEEISPYGTIGGHEYVDLALPSGNLWSTCNFGAFSETSYGSYYKWSTEDKVPSSWGNKWATPTKNDFVELLNYCSYEWTEKNGTNGYLFTGSNGATMFLPAAGFKIYVEGYGYSDIQSGGKQIMYWSNSKSDYSWEGQTFAYALDGSATSLSPYNTYNTTTMAGPIRPVSK